VSGTYSGSLARTSTGTEGKGPSREAAIASALHLLWEGGTVDLAKRLAPTLRRGLNKRQAPTLLVCVARLDRTVESVWHLLTARG